MNQEQQFEMADRLAEAEREAGITRARKRIAPETHPDFDGTHCVECEVDIPAARLALGKVRCVDCQLLLERGRK